MRFVMYDFLKAINSNFSHNTFRTDDRRRHTDDDRRNTVA